MANSCWVNMETDFGDLVDSPHLTYCTAVRIHHKVQGTDKTMKLLCPEISIKLFL